MAYAVNDGWTFRSGIGRFLNRPQINTSAAYGFNPPLSDMATVITATRTRRAAPQRRSFPLVMAMFSPDYANAELVGVERHDGQTAAAAAHRAAVLRRPLASNLERARNINQLQPGTIQANPGVNANALRPYKGFCTITLYETPVRRRTTRCSWR
jgi:hypothetical protein